MNILWLSHNVPYPPFGGVLQRNYNLIKQIALQHDVYLVVFNQKALLPTEKDINEAKYALGKFCARVEILPIPSDVSKLSWYKLVSASFFTKDSYNVNWLKSTRMHSIIREMVQKIKFDIIHYDTIGLTEYLDDTAGIPRVLNHHNVESSMMRRRSQKERNIFKKLYFLREAVKLRELEKRVCRRFDKNLVVSSLDGKRLREIDPDLSIAVVSNGVDTDYFKPNGIASTPESLVMVGGMSWYPNLDGALYFCQKIWPLIVSKFPGVTMKIIGRHPPAEIVSLARKDMRISVMGFVDDIRPHMGEASVYVSAIRDGGGTRLKILDAMAMGKAIVCTSVACEGIEAVHGKHLLVADDPEKFADRISDLFGNVGQRRSLEDEARALALGKYDWSRIAAALSAAYSRS